MPPSHVFGYGSLALHAVLPARLRGHRRVWGVAMDNRRAIAGYKVFEEPDGHRPPVDVTFLDVVPDPAGVVNGALVPVDEQALAVLDERERQYDRVDVTAAVHPAPGGTVWTYVGRAVARARVHHGRPVVVRAYLELVERGFAALGPGQLDAFRTGTGPVPHPVADLARINL